MYNINILNEELNFYIVKLDVERSKKTLKNYYTSNKLFIKYLTNNNITQIDQNNILDILDIIEKYRHYLKHQRKNKVGTRKRYLREILQFLKTLGLKIKIELPKTNYKNKKSNI
ncbi:hypothetical protein ALNOE001_22070 [Candidatus Methanobinarius endosymbioticus]|uniref:Core-binding (CB) domain-containing protein n=1 Tax=Candidatus Methanobinarius endosymbioticus TaxID=2006182 RepID=A0A366MA67_9EURY|nr:hypothetical protein ALNOE001_22070 [Candidatus Methanobinarius endosymbioticus]